MNGGLVGIEADERLVNTPPAVDEASIVDDAYEDVEYIGVESSEEAGGGGP